MPGVLAFDLGGSSIRLAIVEPDGKFSATARKPLSIENRGNGQFEADPGDWWRAFVAGCAELVSGGHDLGQLDAIAGCGFTRTQVFLDSAGDVIRPAITFQDSRSAHVLSELRAETSDATRAAIDALGPYDPLARLLWLKAQEPDHWARLRKVIEPKDYINLMLTGITASDRISQSPMTRSLGPDRGDLLASLGISPEVLPDLHTPDTPIGPVLADLPAPLSTLAGTSVFCGSMDTWSAVLGSGGLRAGVAYGISGTSDVSGLVSATPHTAQGLLSVEWGRDLWQLGGPSQGAATRLQWAVDRFCPGKTLEDAVNDALEDDTPCPLFLPYLDGERTPWWDPDLSGAFLGLQSAHGTRELIRAVAEGINYLSHEILSRAERSIGKNVSHVCFSGGLARNSALCQLKADVLNRPVRVPHNAETGLVGASMIPTLCVAGSQPDSHTFTLFTPRPERRQYYDNRIRLLQEATASLSSILKSLAKAEPT